MIYRRPALVLLIAAALLLAPSLVFGTLNSHSSPQNLTWAGQFAEQFRAGVLYPRWLPESFDGLGGPAFYFYPPLAFWVDALLSIATFNILTVSARLSLSALLLLWGSGLAMRAWLASERASYRTALLGALAYMAAPYHLIDHYYRGAYAEFAAYAVLPLVVLAIRKVADGQRFGPILLAIAYAALPMAHLPTSLLISLTLLPMYVLFLGWQCHSRQRAVWFFGRCAMGGALGLGLASIYLVPALTLQDWIPADSFWSDDYRADRWFLLMPWRWPGAADMMWMIAAFALSYGIAAAGVMLVAWRGHVSDAPRRESVFWAAVCLVCLLLVAGIVPWFWQIPFVAKVQFPWRLMIVVEFAAITAFCLVPWPVRPRLLAYVFLLAILPFIPAVGELAAGVRMRVLVFLATPDSPADLKQFLPAGYPQRPNSGYAELGLGPVAGIPPISCTPQARLCRATVGELGTARLEVDSDVPTSVVLRRFFFPFWRLDPFVPIVATDPLRLVSFTALPGHHDYRLERTAVVQEKAGWAISAASLALLLAWGAALCRGSQRTQ